MDVRKRLSCKSGSGVGRANPVLNLSMTQDDHFPEGTLVAVLTTEPLDRPLDYKAPEGGCRLGDFVQVPLGPRKV